MRYIHLNPIRAKVVNGFKELDAFRFVGHSYLMGRQNNDWQALGPVSARFGDRGPIARRRYRDYVKKSITLGQRPEFMGWGRSHPKQWWLVRGPIHAPSGYRREKR